ncbi:hypothetical protein ACHQM5_001942 [Ranunculus cassubicifolius]
MSIEEGKDLSAFPRSSQSRVFPLRLLQFFVLFLVLGIGFLVLSMYYFGVQNVVNKSRATFQSCIEEPITLERWIKPPYTPMHKMSDEELFWRATFVPRVKKYPFKRTPKIAFMFLTRGPLPLAPLWERFLKGHEGLFSIYIHTLPTYHANFTSSSVFYKRQIPSQLTEWGKMSLVDAERRLLANALLDINNERFVLVSESCIPLYNFSIIYHYLMKSLYSFMGAFDDAGPYGRGRYNERMAPDVKISQWRKSSQWFEINRKLAINIVEDTKFYPKFEEFCRPACYVDEHYFPTMLTIQSPHILANRTITWVDWSRGGAHPATFAKNDINEAFLKKIMEGKTCLYNNQPNPVCFLFARKFAPSALGPLWNHASKIFGY